MSAEALRVVASDDEPVQSTGLVRREVRDCAIDVNNATIRYPIGPYVRGSIKANLMRLMGARGEKVGKVEYVNALTDISFKVTKGERVGIIGSNGSGKSTLLRAMAGIYPIATGSIALSGELGTLLEVGLGFEAESTGRENIYYRGMAMGISPRRLREAEQAIVDFADLGAFIDLPMRTYSTGMWVRLGFAVSTHFSPDVLLIDEVFGAGDAAFAQRALARMKEIVQHAGIVVIVTHDLYLVRSLCTRALWLDRGKIIADGPADYVANRYENRVASRPEAVE
ncbi:MAG: ABC transporter ATP-binding protein [Hyphomonadaceae bacterium]